MSKKAKLYQLGGIQDEDFIERSIPDAFADMDAAEYEALPEFGDDLEGETETLGLQTALLSETPADYGSIADQLPEDYGKYKQDFDLTSVDQLDAGLSEFRGLTQSIGDKWGNGLCRS